VALLLSAAFWAWLWGPAGLLLAVPLTVCVAVMSKYIPQLEFLRVLLGDEPVLEPHQRLYQHLLASNRDTADTLLDEALRTSGSMLTVADQVIVPAVRLMEGDYDRRALGAAKRKLMLDHVNLWVEERLDSLDSLDPTERGLSARKSWILCVPADDRADEVVAKLLATALLERGIGAAFIKPEALDRIPLGDDTRTIDAVVVSALPPEAVAPARAVCRTVRSRSRDLPILVGLWDPEGDLTKPRQRLQIAGAGHLVVTFVECVASLEVLAAAAAAAAAASQPHEPPPGDPSRHSAVLQT
jgi:hypothetical protein